MWIKGGNGNIYQIQEACRSAAFLQSVVTVTGVQAACGNWQLKFCAVSTIIVFQYKIRGGLYINISLSLFEKFKGLKIQSNGRRVNSDVLQHCAFVQMESKIGIGTLIYFSICTQTLLKMLITNLRSLKTCINTFKLQFCNFLEIKSRWKMYEFIKIKY